MLVCTVHCCQNCLRQTLKRALMVAVGGDGLSSSALTAFVGDSAHLCRKQPSIEKPLLTGRYEPEFVLRCYPEGCNG